MMNKIINKNKIKAYKKPIMFHRLPRLAPGRLHYMVGFFVCLFFACPAVARKILDADSIGK